MADTVAEDLSRGHEFSQAWEPAERATYQPSEKPGLPVSYSRPVSSQATSQAAQGAETGLHTEAESANPHNTAQPEPEPVTRRQYVITLSEAAMVDRVLGERAAVRLVELCQEAEKHGW
jgi:hypothetical protein